MFKAIAKELCPPVVWHGLIDLKAKFRSKNSSGHGETQDLELYWNPKMAASLETWGARNAWPEIQMFLNGEEGKVLDIACGTGTVIELLGRFPALEVHGCDISDFLLNKAIERGIPRERLTCCDATAMPYPEQYFDFAYSIGSLEHFTEDGMLGVLGQCRRSVKGRSFHMVPVSRSGRDEGWITPHQSYFNNNTDWWINKCRKVFSKVTVIDSAWEDRKSVGIWLICE